MVCNSIVVALRDRIDAVADDRCSADKATVSVEIADGRTLDRHVEHAVGSLYKPMSDDQLRNKFVDQCARLMGKEGAEAASSAAWAIGEAADVTEVIRKL